MYSNKENVNILTALLVAHGIHHAVVCPGSRNAPIVHNLNECPDIACHPVTDERSAGFYALGMAQALDEPVVVCVTSGTALLNLAPAVAEAFYQHQRLIVISADRPAQWIDQLDGQTLPQPGAFGQFIGASVSLPEPHNDEERWYCNRLVNEALIAAWRRKPVQINVPISEPLFLFETRELPEERMIEWSEPSNIFADIVENGLAEDFCHACKPMIVIGQYTMIDDELVRIIDKLKEYAVVLYEPLSHPQGGAAFDEVLQRVGDDDRYLPDFLLYCGDTIVSKRLKIFLRKGVERVWEITEDGKIHDTFMCVDAVIDGSAWTVLCNLSNILTHEPFLDEYKETDFTLQDTSEFTGLWHAALSHQEDIRRAFIPPFSQMAAVRYFEENFNGGRVHYANSTAIRLANIYARHYVYCNRGVNGIEGSLSTAAGCSLVTEEKVFCIIGDLSFFYDQNALWNQNLRGNLRVMLLNNGKGGIFNMLPGLEKSAARNPLVSAEHSTSAEGICLQNKVLYMKAVDMQQMNDGIQQLLSMESPRPVLLEVFTDAATDSTVFQHYYKQ
jgi:2-succinyl-5-enolpyruvyl-6-hydroxy-3-cyclohexene-1-carboxylate synthase